MNVIIGRNNTGKSRLLDLVNALCDGAALTTKWDLQFRGRFEEAELRKQFPDGASGGVIGHNFWHGHGEQFIGVEFTAEFGKNEKSHLELHHTVGLMLGLQHHQANDAILNERRVRLIEAAKQSSLPLRAKLFRRLSAERDIRPEQGGNNLAIGPDGHGASNIIRRYLTTSNSSLPREVIQRELLAALNEVFGPDGHFLEIVTRQHDEPEESDQSGNHWEIYLAEEKKGLIALSRSGSGLKTVLLALLNLLVVPAMEKKKEQKADYVFAFEELETHLHPALLRRLFAYIERYVVQQNAMVFLTTHSSVALDVFGVSSNAQITHVQHDGESAATTTVAAHFDRQSVVAELGAKPSDLLQANGVVWVEGPSDRIYLNRWIDLASNGKLKEGRDYVCAFYGGSLIANAQFASPEEAEPELSNLLRVNHNVVVVCDSDRTAATGEGAQLKGRVLRIQQELAKIPNSHLWITETKESENYLTAATLRKVFADETLEAPKPRQRFFPSESGSNSYVEQQLKRKTIDKVELATRAAREMTLVDLQERFDWNTAMKAIVTKIAEWNA